MASVAFLNRIRAAVGFATRLYSPTYARNSQPQLELRDTGPGIAEHEGKPRHSDPEILTSIR